MKSAWRLKLKYPHRKYLLIQLFCLSACVAFFSLTTSSILAQPKNQVQKSDPYSLTPEKQGMFQGLPEKFKGLFNSDSQVLNGFFQFIERNLGGASARQVPPTIPTYPPYQFPMPVSADFIKVTSSRRADCTQDVPPDELLPATCDDTADSKCPWTASQPPPCPGQPGPGCCTIDDGLGGSIEFCITGGPGGTLIGTNTSFCDFEHFIVQAGSTLICGPGNISYHGQTQNFCDGYFTSGGTYNMTGRWTQSCSSHGCCVQGNLSCSATAR